MNSSGNKRDKLEEAIQQNLSENNGEYTCKDLELQIGCMQRIVEFFKEIGDPNKTKFDRHKYLKFRNSIVNLHGQDDTKEKNLLQVMRNKKAALQGKLSELKEMTKNQRRKLDDPRSTKEVENEFNFKLVMYKNLFDEYQHRKQTMKMMQQENDCLKASKKQNDDINADRLVVLEAKIGKIYELLPCDFKFPETDEKSRRYTEGNIVDIEDQEEEYLEQVSDRVYEKLLRDEARLITNEQYTPN